MIEEDKKTTEEKVQNIEEKSNKEEEKKDQDIDNTEKKPAAEEEEGKEEEEEEEEIKEKESTKNKEKLESLNSIRPGDIIKVYEIANLSTSSSKKTKNKEQKDKIQVFEGLVLARKHGKQAGATITVRKVVDGIGVEKIFPLLSPRIQKIKIVKRNKVRRAKLYYLREAKGKRARLKAVPLANERGRGKDKDKKL